jgi:hypothetical protein
MPLALMGLLICAASLCAAQVSVDSASARAVLKALGNANLIAEQALEICRMPGNQGLVRKENSYGRNATTQSCADALLAVAQGKTPDPAFQFRFGPIKLRTAELTALLDRIEANPVTFRDWVEARVTQFSPPNSRVPMSGHLVVGGVSGGFAFGQPEFYLNLAYFDDFDVARVVMAHELYHAVQGAFAIDQQAWWSGPDARKGPGKELAQQCSTTNDYFDALYEEGTASYVGDPLLLRDAKGEKARKMMTEMEDGIAHPRNSVTLLELSILGLNAPDPVPFDQVYALGFYVPEIEYKLGYRMAKSIAAEHGDRAIAAFLQQPPYAFTAAYVSLPEYGKDAEHPGLGPNTLAALKRLQDGCPQPAAR